MRAHLFQTLTDSAGNVLNGAQVRVLEATTLDSAGNPNPDVPIAATLFNTADPLHSITMPSTFTAENGVVDLWLDNPQYVKLGITPTAGSESFIDGIPALAPSSGGGPRGGVQAYAWSATHNMAQSSSGGQARPADGWDFTQIGPAGLPEIVASAIQQFSTTTEDPTYGWSGSAAAIGLHTNTPGWYEVRLGVEAKFWDATPPEHADLSLSYSGQPSQSGVFRIEKPGPEQGMIWFNAGTHYLDGDFYVTLTYPFDGVSDTSLGLQFIVEVIGL